MVSSGVGVGEAEHGEGPHGRRLDQPDRRLRDDAAGALGADHRLGEVDLPGQELVQVVTGDAAGQVRKPARGRRPDPRAQGLQRVGDRPGSVAPHRHPLAAVGEDVERVHVVDRLAPRHGVRSAGVVADHPAEGAAVVCGRVGAERQRVRRRGVAHGVADHAGLDARGAGLRVDLQNAVHVPGEVEHDGGVDRLPGDRGARTDGQHRHVVAAAHRQCRFGVRDVARHDDADRHPPVVRGVGRPHGPVGGGEPHGPGDGAPQVGGQRLRIGILAHGVSVPACPPHLPAATSW